jgi:tRNA/rRNA methyltransferase
MGFEHFRLLSPCDFLSERARWVAHGSQHILENAAVFDHFAESTQDLDFIIGATARRRGTRREYFSGEELPHLIQSKGDAIRDIGLVFGCEDRGLLNDENAVCDALVTLNMRAPYPSLNLSQAVMVFAYILSPLVLQAPIKKLTTLQENEFKSLKNRIKNIFALVGLDQNPDIVNRLLERLVFLSGEDVHLLHSVCARLERKIF